MQNYKNTFIFLLKNLNILFQQCFMNSMIQCLSHSVQLRDYCLRQEYMLQINTASSMRGKLIKGSVKK